MYTSHLKKTAGSVGEMLGLTAMRAFGLVKKYPKSSIATAAALMLGVPYLATKRDRNVQDYQTSLLRNIANSSEKAVKQQPVRFKQAVPIVPPLR